MRGKVPAPALERDWTVMLPGFTQPPGGQLVGSISVSLTHGWRGEIIYGKNE